jgi:hypothetical protein
MAEHQLVEVKKEDKSEVKINNILLKIEKELGPIIDYLNENDIVIKISGNIWNQIFNFFNTINKTKKNVFDIWGIPKSEDLWKAIYEIEKNNLINELNQIIEKNQKFFKKNKVMETSNESRK